MTLKVKLFYKDNGQEVDDVSIFQKLSRKIRDILKNELPEFDSIIKVYGEIVPLR